MNKIIRVFGGVIGFAEVVVGAHMIYHFGFSSVVRLGGSIALICVGFVFLYYAFTGKTLRRIESDSLFRSRR